MFLMQHSSDSDESALSVPRNMDLSDCGSFSYRFMFPTPPRPRLSKSADNSCSCSSQSDSSTARIRYSKKQRNYPGFVKRLPPLGIFWDIENVRVPKMKSASVVVQKIREVFLENYRESEFVVVCDVKRENPQIIQELHDSQVNLLHVSSSSKNAADEKLRQSLRRYAELHPAPSGIVLISGDINFASDLSDLRYRKKIRVILVHNVNVADALILCANEHHSFTELTENLPLTSTRKAKDTGAVFYLTVLNIPKNIDAGRVKTRLHSLTNNCGGKCIQFISAEGIACLRFGNFDLALRAQKRIQGEDVFGNKIKVLSPSVRSYGGKKVKTVDSSCHSTSYNIAPPPGFNLEGSRTDFPQNHLSYRDSRELDQQGTSSSSSHITFESYPSNLHTMGRSLINSTITPIDVNMEQHLVVGKPILGRPRTPQEQTSVPLFKRSHTFSGSSDLTDTERKNESKNSNKQPVELNISNLDPTIEFKELRRLLTNMIKEYAMILSLNIIVQPDGTPVANLKIGSQQEAQFIISKLHRQKLGHKRIMISYAQNNQPDPDQLKAMIISILQEVPDKSMPLFKFMELLESRFHCTVSVSDVNKLKDVARITDNLGSRIISLTQEVKISPPPNLTKTMVPFCTIHCPNGIQSRGWCEFNSSYVPNIMMSLANFTSTLMRLLDIHLGSMPLLSFQACYEQEFHDPLPVDDSGVPLEHLITCVPNIEIKLVGPNRNIKIIKHGLKQETSDEESILKAVAAPLAPNVNLLCRELVDLLKTMEKCQLLLTKFIPAYHHHFGRQCRVADYGFTKLLDLFESISHVIQIMGDGTRRIITLTHTAQMRRFTSDLLRVLKVQPSKQISAVDFPGAYEKVMNKQFNPVEYGLCTFMDLLQEIPENTLLLNQTPEGMMISVPKREQTAEEILRTKQFANEVIDLLRHTPYYTMLFNKFVPAYHHHFGHQCKVSDYGFTKLIELFEAIPHIVKIEELPDGERTVTLTVQQSLKILGYQILQIIKGLDSDTLNLNDLPIHYFREYGYPLKPQIYQCTTLSEVISKVSDYVQVIESNTGILLRPIQMDTIPNILRVRCWALLLDPPHCKDLVTFRAEYYHCYKSSFSPDALQEVSNVVSISLANNVEYISLTAMYTLAAQLYHVICSNGGYVAFNCLERLYYEMYSKSLKLSTYHIYSPNDFYKQLNLLFYVRGNQRRSIIVLNRNLSEHLTPLSSLTSLEPNYENKQDTQWLEPPQTDLAQATRKFSPPKPDTPPTPGTSSWQQWCNLSKSDDSSNLSINMPITHHPTLLGNTNHLISPARHLLPVGNNSWIPVESKNVPPDPSELPLPEKFLPKENLCDESADSGVNIKLDNSPSDNENEQSTSHGQFRGTPKLLWESYLNFQ